MRRTWAITITITSLLTLGAGMGALDASTNTISSSSSSSRQVGTCDPADPATCAYVPEQVYEVGVVRDVELVDADRNGYPVPLVIHYPLLDTRDERPVVIWHHGGAPSRRGADRSENWGRELAAAGYVVIHPSRVPIDDPSPFQDECTANGFPAPDECAHWRANNRDGAITTRFLIEHLDEVEALVPADPPGFFDADRIVVGGHSAGSAAVLANAGAWQQWDPGADRYDERIDSPVAFLASGVQGPMYAGFGTGFQPNSYVGIDRPFLSITGVGDDTGEPPPSRVTGWLTSVGTGDQLLSWDTDPEAVHETMNIRKCDSAVQAAHCDWIADIGVAFLDAVVRHRPAARDWLNSGAVEVLTGGAIELHRR